MRIGILALSRLLLCGVIGARFALPIPAGAGSVQPSPPAASFTNSVSFDLVHNAFEFDYAGTDGTLAYKYIPGLNGSLHGLQCVVNKTNTFLPCNYGGLSLWSGSAEFYPYSSGVTFQLLSAQTNGTTLQIHWRMTAGGSQLLYNYQFQMTGRTLTVQAASESGVAAAVYLDRCENAAAPVEVHVPCLATMNVLYNAGAFCSAFFDWENTAASTIYPADGVFSASSVYYAQQAVYLPRTDGTRHAVNETIYLTVSPSLPDVLPNIPNPVSPYKTLGAHYVIFDSWLTPFAATGTDVAALAAAGVSNLWIILHDWQNAGYDNRYPDVIPANPAWGGDAGVNAISGIAATNGYLFALHENYVDFYTNAPAWDPAAIGRNSDGSLSPAWHNPITGIQSYLMKPSLASNYLAQFAPLIHQAYGTTASFLDVHSAINPSDRVDYDAAVTNAGMYAETLARYRALGGLLRGFHHGPVSGEGRCHLLHLGYFDDVEGQLNSGGNGPYSQAAWLPLLVDFDLLKLHDKAVVHGVGYYERFFADANDTPQDTTFQMPAVLEYQATELAFGRGGFLPAQGRVYDYVAVAKLEETGVLPAQMLYANVMPVSIRYHDSGSNDEVTVSDFIRRHPASFATSSNDNYLSQVRVTYDNGVVVCVNRHPTRSWSVTVGSPGGFFDYNASVNGILVQGSGPNNATTYVLPPVNGWVVFGPDPAPPQISAVHAGNGTVGFTIANLPVGSTNRVERSPDLQSNNWQVVDTFVSGAAATNWSQTFTGNAANAFYRVVRLW